jgi:hypothetical protein
MQAQAQSQGPTEGPDGVGVDEGVPRRVSVGSQRTHICPDPLPRFIAQIHCSYPLPISIAHIRCPYLCKILSRMFCLRAFEPAPMTQAVAVSRHKVWCKCQAA